MIQTIVRFVCYVYLYCADGRGTCADMTDYLGMGKAARRQVNLEILDGKETFRYVLSEFLLLEFTSHRFHLFLSFFFGGATEMGSAKCCKAS